MPAVMTLHARRLPMHRQTCAAARAVRLPPACGALERGRIATAIDKHKRLLAARNTFGQRVPQRARDSVAPAFAAIGDKRDPRQLRAWICAARKQKTAIL